MLTLVALKNELKAFGVNLDSLIGDSNPKIKKSAEKTFILHLDADITVCAKMGLCAELCLKKAGNPAYKTAKDTARRARTKLYNENRQLFLFAVVVAIARIVHKWGLVAIRLNGTSDIPYEHKSHRIQLNALQCTLLARYGVNVKPGDYSVFELFPNNQFYDYTKIHSRLYRELPANYYLTFSLDGPGNRAQAEKALKAGFNVAVPFYKLPEQFTIGKTAATVINGDLTDYRPNDPQGVVVGLKYKRVSNGEKVKNNGFIIDSVSV